MDLTPSQLIQHGRPFDSLFSEDKLEFYEQRDREIQWSHESNKRISVMETCGNKILIGLENGEIQIFSTVDLQCQITLSHPELKSKVTCLHCTCSEVIAGYEDCSACIWNIQSGDLTQRFCVGDRTSSTGYAKVIRLKGTRLVVATVDGVIGIWNYSNGSVKFVSEWRERRHLRRLEIAGDSIILMELWKGVSVYKFDGTPVHKICNPEAVKDVGIYGDYAITGDKKCCRLLLWHIGTGTLIGERRGQGSQIKCVSARDGHVLSVDKKASVVIWSTEAILEGRPAALMKIFDPSDSPQAEIQCCSLYSLGPNYFVRLDPNKSVIKVTDFL